MARKKVKPNLDEIEAKAENPFALDESFQVRVNVIKQFGKHGQVHEAEMESQQYTKLFRHSDTRKKIANLLPASRSILFWMCYSIEKTRHCIWLDRKRMMKECAIASDNTVRKAIDQLIDKGFIAATSTQTVYWINPNIFFCGSRVNKYSDKVVRNGLSPLGDASSLIA